MFHVKPLMHPKRNIPPDSRGRERPAADSMSQLTSRPCSRSALLASVGEQVLDANARQGSFTIALCARASDLPESAPSPWLRERRSRSTIRSREELTG